MALGGRAARMRGIDGPGIAAAVRENPFNERRRLDAGDDAQAATACRQVSISMANRTYTTHPHLCNNLII